MNQELRKLWTRRAFLGKVSAGAALLGVATAVSGSVSASSAHTRAGAPDHSRLSNEPVVAYVRDARTGEISLLVGTREVTIRDPHLAAQLNLAAAREVR